MFCTWSNYLEVIIDRLLKSHQNELKVKNACVCRNIPTTVNCAISDYFSKICFVSVSSLMRIKHYFLKLLQNRTVFNVETLYLELQHIVHI